MVHRDLRAMTRYATERGIHPMICTNGGLWTEENMRGLAGDGLTSVIMSIDGARHRQAEKKPRPAGCLPENQTPPTNFSHSVGVQTTASVTASRLIDNYDKLPAFLESLGFTSCTFSYPLTSAGQQLSELSAAAGW